MKRLLLDLFNRFNSDDVPALGSQLAYNLLLSFFPFIIFLMTIIGNASLDNEGILLALGKLVPASAYNLISTTVTAVITTRHTHLMSISFIIMLWSASSGFNAVIKGLNKAYGVAEQRSFVKVRLISMLCTLGMAFIILIMMTLLVLGRIILNYAALKFGFSKNVVALWTVIRYLIVVATAIFIFTGLYRFAPSKKLAWWEVLPGALFTTLSLILASLAFAYYVNNFANYSVVYGSIGAIIILLFWLFIVSIIVIFGGEINASLCSETSHSNITYKRTFNSSEWHN